jgi:hypothetical protein
MPSRAAAGSSASAERRDASSEDTSDGAERRIAADFFAGRERRLGGGVVETLSSTGSGARAAVASSAASAGETVRRRQRDHRDSQLRDEHEAARTTGAALLDDEHAPPPPRSHPLTGFASDRVRRAVWPVMLARTADRHLSVTARKKRRREAAAGSVTSSSTAASATASSRSAHGAPAMMTIDEAETRFRDGAADAFPPRCSAAVVAADVRRSLFEIPEGALREALRGVLARTLLRVCAADERVHYYQGMHDVATVLLRIYFDERVAHYAESAKPAASDACATAADAGVAAAAAAAVVSGAGAARLEDRLASTLLELVRSRLERFSAPTMLGAVGLLTAMHGVLQRVAPRVAFVLESNGVAPTWTFALSWVITWFAHDVPEGSGGVLRCLFDALVRTHQHMVAFVAVAVVVHFFRPPLSAIAPTLEPFDTRLYGTLVPGIADAPESVLSDPGQLYTMLKKLPMNLAPAAVRVRSDSSSRDAAFAAESAALDRLDAVLATAARIERAHKQYFLDVLADPDTRVVLLTPPPLPPPPPQPTAPQQRSVSNNDAIADGGNGNGDASPPAQPSSTAGTLANRLRVAVFFGVVAVAAVAQVVLEQRRLALV